MADIDGSGSPDKITGTDEGDVLSGHGDDDVLYGEDGNDELYGSDGEDTLDGGAGNDTLTGGSDADTFVFRDGYGKDIITDFDHSADVVQLTASGIQSWEDIECRLAPGKDGSAELTLEDGSVLRFQGLKVDELGPKHFVVECPPVCLVAGTRLRTPKGYRRVEALRPGDTVSLWGGGTAPVVWVGGRVTRFGHGPHRHRPIRIAPGALGPGCPAAPLTVSPQHHIALRTALGPVLAKAKGLIGRAGVSCDMACQSVRYVQVLLPTHAILDAQGAPVESFWPGCYAMAGLPAQDRAAISRAFPGVADTPTEVYGPPCLPRLKLRAIRDLTRIRAAQLPVCVA